MRYAARRDQNDPELKQIAEALGWWLVKTDEPGDYLGGFRGHWYVVEIKRADKQGWASEYTDAQKVFHCEAAKRDLPVLTWRRPDDVIRSTNRPAA